jgi:predicted dehydrogenase
MTLQRPPLSRRALLKTGAAAAAFTIVHPRSVRGTQAAAKLRLGIIGAGGRGTFVGQRLYAHPEIQITALADLYDDKIDQARERFSVPRERCFKGFEAFKQLLASDVDAVLLSTPPRYRADHLEAAVAAGKHAYAEKPLSIDPPGCRRIIAAGEKAREKKLTIVAGLQRRYAECYREVKSRIERGDLGQIVSARAQWLSADLTFAREGEKDHVAKPREEREIRLWYFYRWLSGDMICEQNVHNLDVANWFIGGHPERAVGYGGRKARTDIGDIFDHFNVVYEYPGGTHLSYASSQFQKGWSDVSEQFFGSEGSADMTDDVRRQPYITGKNPWKYDGPNGNAHHVTNAVAALVASVRGIGEYRNDARYGAESTLTAILGRKAAFDRREVTWEEVLKDNTVIAPPS